jgi:hypothetical protein
VVFVDLSKAYGRVPVRNLWEILQGSPISISVVKAIKHLYEKSNLRLKLSEVFSTEFPVAKGLRQGCCLSHALFKIYLDKVLEKWRRNCNPMGIPITEETFLFTLHFADDQEVNAQDKIGV